MEDSDDVQLSPEALIALHEFMREQNVAKTESENFVNEDWQLSQFWYDEETSITLAKAAYESVSNIENKRIACISCPSIYHRLRKISHDSDEIFLFEYDKRFQEKYSDAYIFYDYKLPLNVDERFNSYFDIVLADPPFLSEECLEKFASTIRKLTDKKIVLCTGAVMENSAKQILNLNPCNFIPKHEKKLGNEFKCYANFNFDEFALKKC